MAASHPAVSPCQLFEDSRGDCRVRLQIRNDSCGFGQSESSTTQTLNVNAVFASMGQTCNARKDLL